MARQRYEFDEDGVQRIVKSVRWTERQPKREGFQKRRAPIASDEGGGGCETQNTIWDITVLGRPTGGTYDLNVVVNNVATWITFDYDMSYTDFATQLATHAEITSSDIQVSGGPHPDVGIRIEFIGALENTYILHPIADATNLTGGSGIGVIVQMAQRGHAG